MRTRHHVEVNASLLNAYRSLRIARLLRINKSRPDWSACAEFHLKNAAGAVRHAVRLRAEEKWLSEQCRASRLEAAFNAPLAEWEKSLLG